MDSIRVLAGDCTVRFDDGADERVQRGHVVCLLKPDRTTLVHDRTGYQPVAWLTRPDALTVADDEDGFVVTARTDERRLRVEAHAVAGRATLPASDAGVPVGTAPPDHPEASGPLVRADGAVLAPDSGARYPLVAGATVLDRTCDDCGLPLMRAERGAAFEVCVDRSCEPLDDAVRERFDRAWTCPDCGNELRIVRRRGRLLAGCDGYPDCETAFSVPAGVVVDDCDCGLPVFETATGERCLDGTCDAFAEGADGSDDADGRSG
ncbi:MAG: topoisomerase DNA-binding C4 zinc finger domain-containing protein [Haloferacaceae archaeon]